MPDGICRLLSGDCRSNLTEQGQATHPILEIDELLRLIIRELMETGQETVLSLVLTCRSLEGPALSSLWKRQETLENLLEGITKSYLGPRWAGN